MPAAWVLEGHDADAASVGAASAENLRDGDHARAADGGTRSEREGVGTAAFVAAGFANLGSLLSFDFRISPGAVAVYEEVSNFTAPPYVSELFVKWSTERMFSSLEVNAMKIGPGKRAPPLWTKS